ncbi:MAG: FprA family A-type flavoprotein [Candidatus Omnitrophota bacterium]
MEIKKDIYWVGGVDWGLRNFHGYITPRGSSYNAYLIVDKKITLIDTVKHYLFDEMAGRIGKIVDPARIDYIISNHTEMDHSGGLPRIMKLAKNAVVVASPNGVKGLKKHFGGQGGDEWRFKQVQSGDILDIGQRRLEFILAPMVHWPDSMATYCQRDRVLFSNDAFGQHIASSCRFAEDLGWDIVREEAAKYYANIVWPYGAQVKRLLGDVSGLKIETIAPSHGLIWNRRIEDIVSLYKRWADNYVRDKAVVIYDTMWGSTEKMAYIFRDVFERKGISCEMKSLKTNDISEIIASILEAKYICIGSPTLNSGILPSVAAFLTYMRGLSPKNRIGFAFGSYGWGGQVVEEIEDILVAAKFELPLKGLKIRYVPSEGELEEMREKLAGVIE